MGDFLAQYWWLILLGFIVLGKIFGGSGNKITKKYYDSGKIKEIVPHENGFRA